MSTGTHEQILESTIINNSNIYYDSIIIASRILPRISLSMELQKAGDFIIVKIGLTDSHTGTVLSTIEEEIDIG